MLDTAQLSNYWQDFKQWAETEGTCRMIEHTIIMIVFLVILRWIARAGSIKSRGKTGMIQNLTKMFVRLSRKFSFVNSKIDKEL